MTSARNEADAIIVIVWIAMVLIAVLAYMLETWLMFGVACWSGGIISRDLVSRMYIRYQNHRSK